jgi:hypothetical protein
MSFKTVPTLRMVNATRRLQRARPVLSLIRGDTLFDFFTGVDYVGPFRVHGDAQSEERTVTSPVAPPESSTRYLNVLPLKDFFASKRNCGLKGAWIAPSTSFGGIGPTYSPQYPGRPPVAITRYCDPAFKEKSSVFSVSGAADSNFALSMQVDEGSSPSLSNRFSDPLSCLSASSTALMPWLISALSGTVRIPCALAA